ncbi:MAG: amidophosphoribosyltransferase [Phycisphaerae bacterium]|nr:amidophosphoribosyltransferase [Phycisphaerae bacterium]
MGDRLTHECGLALLRLKHPLSWFQSKLGDPLWGLRRLYLLMEKQHNRGQDGAGIAMAKFDMPPGERFIDRIRSAKRSPIERIFAEVLKPANEIGNEALLRMHPSELKRKIPMLGEVMMGHLRYGTHAGNGSGLCHPYLRTSNVASRNLALAGNFNLTNSRELFEQLVSYGLNPVGDADTGVMLEKIGHSLDREHRFLASTMGPETFRNLDGAELATAISKELDLHRVLGRATEDCDGGFVLTGILGNGDCFALRDRHGIRPAFYVETDEAIAVASERPALVTVLGAKPDQVKQLPPAHAIVVKADGTTRIEAYCEAGEERQCTFERIYFSRGNDASIYRERKALGEQLAKRVLDAVDWKIDSTVFGFIPNTSETAYYGLLQRMEHLVAERSGDQLWKLVQTGKATRDDVMRFAHPRIRAEKVATKDQKLRTFITNDAARKELVQHVYDITRDTVRPGDTLVVIDDSIVRGTTLRESIITMLSRLEPARIVVVSSAPPIMYPDCYGIDMSQLGRFIAFEAAVALHHERGTESVLAQVEERCLAQRNLPAARMQNHVAAVYDAFTLDEISAKVAQLVRSPQLAWGGAIDLLYQTIDGLHAAMPGYTGDWFFTGRYPTPGGYKVLNTAYLNWRKHDEARSY